LCQKYIDGTIKDYTLDGVVKRMCQMKYIYDYCHMDDCFDIAKERYGGYCFNIHDEAEDIALELHSNGKYPKEWPWIKRKNKVKEA
jgi:hypothetical protein